ncbi:hypothetical protein SEVIR_8G218365v4 [Setaria viridis]
MVAMRNTCAATGHDQARARREPPSRTTAPPRPPPLLVEVAPALRGPRLGRRQHEAKAGPRGTMRHAPASCRRVSDERPWRPRRVEACAGGQGGAARLWRLAIDVVDSWRCDAGSRRGFLPPLASSSMEEPPTSRHAIHICGSADRAPGGLQGWATAAGSPCAWRTARRRRSHGMEELGGGRHCTVYSCPGHQFSHGRRQPGPEAGTVARLVARTPRWPLTTPSPVPALGTSR